MFWIWIHDAQDTHNGRITRIIILLTNLRLSSEAPSPCGAEEMAGEDYATSISAFLCVMDDSYLKAYLLIFVHFPL